MPIYATAADLETWTGRAAPSNADILLREASGMVADAIAADIYEVTATGLPLDPTLRTALKEATCQQAGFWSRHSIDPTAGRAGLDAVVTASSIDGASVSTNAGELAAQKAASVDGLTEAALRILRRAGLATSWAWSA